MTIMMPMPTNLSLTDVSKQDGSRVWLESEDDYLRIHTFIKDGLPRIHAVSTRFPPVTEECVIPNRDLYSDRQYIDYDSNTYPPDGAESVFLDDRFLANEDWDVLGKMYYRKLSVKFCRFSHDPNYTKTAPYSRIRDRPSCCICDWSFDIEHLWIGGNPTGEYFHNFSSYGLDFSLYGKFKNGLMTMLGIRPLDYSEIVKLADAELAKLSGAQINIEKRDAYLQKWGAGEERWRGEVPIFVTEPGLFGSTRKSSIIIDLPCKSPSRTSK